MLLPHVPQPMTRTDEVDVSGLDSAGGRALMTMMLVKVWCGHVELGGGHMEWRLWPVHATSQSPPVQTEASPLLLPLLLSLNLPFLVGIAMQQPIESCLCLRILRLETSTAL